MTRHKLRIAMALLPLCLAVPAGCGGQGGESQDVAMQPMRIGWGPWPAFDLTLHAASEGMFEAEGIRPRLHRFADQHAATRAMVLGRLDVLFTSASDLAMIGDADAKDPLVVIGITNQSAGADGLVARPGISGVADLAGRRVACKRGTVNEMILLEALVAHGVEPDAVELVDVPNQAADRWLSSGRVAAAVLWEPDLTKAAEGCGGKVIHTTGMLDSVVLDCIVVRQSLLDRDPELAGRVMRAWFRVTDAVAADPKAVFSDVAGHLQMPAAEFEDAFKGLLLGDAAMNRQYFTPDQQGAVAFEGLVQRIQTLFSASGNSSRVVKSAIPWSPGPFLQATGAVGQRYQGLASPPR